MKMYINLLLGRVIKLIHIYIYIYSCLVCKNRCSEDDKPIRAYDKQAAI